MGFQLGRNGNTTIQLFRMKRSGRRNPPCDNL